MELKDTKEIKYKWFIKKARACKILEDFNIYPPFLSFEGFPRS